MADLTGAPTQTGSLIGGGLAGLLAASVFGGPIGAAIGLGVGLLSDRERKSTIDLAVDDQNAIQKYGSDIMQRMQAIGPYVETFGKQADPSGSYNEQFSNIASQVMEGNKLSQHYDSKIRESGLTQLAQAGVNLNALTEDLGNRTQSLADREFAAQQKGADYYQGRIDVSQDKLRELQGLHDQAMNQINNLGPDDPATKATLMNMIEMSPREADADAVGIGLAPFGVGVNFDINQWHPTLDQAYKIAASVKDTKIKSLADYVSQLADSAKQQGYTFNTTKDGAIKVGTNINAVIQNFRSVAPSGVEAPKPAQTATQKAVGAVEGAVNKTTDVLGKTDLTQPGYTGEVIGGAIDASTKAAKDAANSVIEWIHSNRGKNWKKRPTNK